MKRIGIFLCCALMILMLCACNGKTDDYDVPTLFYYNCKDVSYNTPSGVIDAEIREGADLHGDLTAFLHRYLQGPVTSDLVRTIPTNVYLVSCELNSDSATIVFNKQFSNLSGVDLVCAGSGLLMSLHDFAGVNTLYISAKDALIEEKEVYVITMDDIVLADSVKTGEQGV